jgi:putative acyl-CoA dehydrogenase
MATAFRSDEIVSPSGPLVGINLFSSDPALMTLVDPLPPSIGDGLAVAGEFWGSTEAYELARLAETNPPALRGYDAVGHRIDLVEYHPAYHALMRRGVAGGLHCSVWDATGPEGPVRTMARAARLFLAAQIDQSHVAALSMNHAGIAALAHHPRLVEEWLPVVRSRRYDSTVRPVHEKTGATIALAVAERQGGSEPRALTTVARRAEHGMYRLQGHKWFVSAPMADGFLTLAQTQEGVTALLLPRYLPDGTRNPFRFLRLKDKLGDRANATVEMEVDGAAGFPLGNPGHGLTVVSEMVNMLRLDDAIVSAALMRIALAEAVYTAREKRLIGVPMIHQPMMVRVLADIGLDVVAAVALAFRVVEAVDAGANDPGEAAFARLMVPAAKYWISKAAGPLIAEAMECVGANGYVEENRLPRLYRGAPALALMDGPGNVLALEAVKLLRRSSDPLEAVLAVADNALGLAGKKAINMLRATTAVALADEGSARILAEQLALVVAAAALRRSFPAQVADAFMESRLGKGWRTTYGMLDARFDSKAFIDFICPARR